LKIYLLFLVDDTNLSYCSDNIIEPRLAFFEGLDDSSAISSFFFYYAAMSKSSAPFYFGFPPTYIDLCISAFVDIARLFKFIDLDLSSLLSEGLLEPLYLFII
jgi:hypothetical protein